MTSLQYHISSRLEKRQTPLVREYLQSNPKKAKNILDKIAQDDGIGIPKQIKMIFLYVVQITVEIFAPYSRKHVAPSVDFKPINCRSRAFYTKSWTNQIAHLICVIST